MFLDRSFRGLTFAFAWLTILLLAYLLWQVGGSAMPAMQKFGLSFLTTATWDVLGYVRLAPHVVLAMQAVEAIQ